MPQSQPQWALLALFFLLKDISLLCGRSSSLCGCAKWSNMIHSYTFLHNDKTSRYNHMQAIGHNYSSQLLYTSSFAAYPCIVNRVLPLWMGLCCLCGTGSVPCGNGKGESKTTPAFCKVFVPAIVGKRLPVILRPHGVIFCVSQGHGIVAVCLNDDEMSFFLFCLILKSEIYL